MRPAHRKERERIFTRSFLGSTGRAADEAGTPSSGYGLYLALRAADKLGVRVSLSDAEGAGTVAAVSIPVERARFA